VTDQIGTRWANPHVAGTGNRQSTIRGRSPELRDPDHQCRAGDMALSLRVADYALPSFP